LIALAVIGLCGLAVSRGWSIVHFCAARAGVASHEYRADALRPWIGAPGLAGAALEASLTDAALPADIDEARKRGDEFAAMLAVRPMASMRWLSLASMRLVTGQPLDMVLEALAMSSMTGANEGHVMSRRAIFGLWQWEILPSHVRKQMAADLAGAVRERTISDQERSAAGRILAAKSTYTCREIAGLLRVEGLSAIDLSRIGLSSCA
jgi:hypothetical protein